MRRIPILLAFGLVAALLVVAAATAAPPNDWCGRDGTKPDHPSCSDTTVPPSTEPPEVCEFVDGVLKGWEPPAPYRCQWTVPQEERDRTFQFSLQPVPDVEGATVNLPHLIVTDVYPSGGDWCLNEHTVGWNDLPYTWSSFTLPADGECSGPGGGLPGSTDGEDVFAITIDVGKVKKADVQLQYTP